MSIAVTHSPGPSTGMHSRARPSRLMGASSPYLSPSFFIYQHQHHPHHHQQQQHSTSALRSSASPAFAASSAGVHTHEFEINPWEVSLAPPGGDDTKGEGAGFALFEQAEASRRQEVGAEVDSAIASSRWAQGQAEEEAENAWRKRGYPSPALVVLPADEDDGEVSRKRARVGAEQEQGGARRLSTASRVACLSPPPLEPSNSMDSISSEESLPCDGVDAPQSAHKLPLGRTPIPLASSTATSTTLARQPSATSQAFANARHYQLAPRQSDLLPPPSRPPKTVTSSTPFIPEYAPPVASSGAVEPAPLPSRPLTRTLSSSLAVNPSPTSAAAPLAPSASTSSSSLLPPSSKKTPSLTPSAAALDAARFPPPPVIAPPPPLEVKFDLDPAALQRRLSDVVQQRGRGAKSRAVVSGKGEGGSAASSAPKAAKDEFAGPGGVVEASGPQPEPSAAAIAADALERNRLAAKKCRAKKKERTNELAAAEEALSQSNATLGAEIVALRAEAEALRAMLARGHPLERCVCQSVLRWRVGVNGMAREGNGTLGDGVSAEDEGEEEVDELEDDELVGVGLGVQREHVDQEYYVEGEGKAGSKKA